MHSSRINPWKVSTLVLVVALGVVIGTSSIDNASAEPQPHMQAALRALTNAKRSLERATPDKGGHRAKALELTNAAIIEVEKGIAFHNKEKGRN